MSKKEVAIIGLGSFGEVVLRTLIADGCDVLVIDKNKEIVNKIAQIASHAVVADSTNEDALKQLGITNFDQVIVAIGQDVHASILTTLVLKDLGVENITVKVSDENHAKIIRKIGSDQIIFPDRDTGFRLARRIMNDGLVDFLGLNESHSMAQVVVEDDKICNQELIELDLINKHQVIVSAIKRGESIIIPRADSKIEKGDTLIIIGENESITKFTKII